MKTIYLKIDPNWYQINNEEERKREIKWVPTCVTQVSSIQSQQITINTIFSSKVHTCLIQCIKLQFTNFLVLPRQINHFKPNFFFFNMSIHLIYSVFINVTISTVTNINVRFHVLITTTYFRTQTNSGT